MFIDKMSEKLIKDFLKKNKKNVNIIGMNKKIDANNISYFEVEADDEIYVFSNFFVKTISKKKNLKLIINKISDVQDIQNTKQWRKFMTEKLGEEYAKALSYFMKVEQQNYSILSNYMNQDSPHM